jgi:hypothetical protein
VPACNRLPKLLVTYYWLPVTFDTGMSKDTKSREPLLLWWMPVVALLAPFVFAAWRGASAEGDGLSEAALALLWPGVPLYLAAIAVLWAGWKIELE